MAAATSANSSSCCSKGSSTGGCVSSSPFGHNGSGGSSSSSESSSSMTRLGLAAFSTAEALDDATGLEEPFRLDLVYFPVFFSEAAGFFAAAPMSFFDAISENDFFVLSEESTDTLNTDRSVRRKEKETTVSLRTYEIKLCNDTQPDLPISFLAVGSKAASTN